jgi:hypothetical protein
VVRKRKQSPDSFSSYEGFVYLLAELELVIEAGDIQWSLPAANATKYRLEELAVKMGRIIAEINNK